MVSEKGTSPQGLGLHTIGMRQGLWSTKTYSPVDWTQGFGVPDWEDDD